jgi:hypothetical protein
MTSFLVKILLHFGQNSLLDDLKMKLPEINVIPQSARLGDCVWVFIDLNNIDKAFLLLGECRHNGGISAIYLWKRDYENARAETILHKFLTYGQVMCHVYDIDRLYNAEI